MGTIPSTSSKSLAKETTFSNTLLIVDTHYKMPKLYGIENITTEEFMDKLDMFQAIFVRVYEFGWWDIKIIKTDDGTHFPPKDFQEGLSVHGVRIELAAPDIPN